MGPTSPLPESPLAQHAVLVADAGGGLDGPEGVGGIAVIEHMLRMKRPVRIVERPAGERDEIGDGLVLHGANRATKNAAQQPFFCLELPEPRPGLRQPQIKTGIKPQ